MLSRAIRTICLLALAFALVAVPASADSNSGRYTISTTGDPQPIEDPLSAFPPHLESSKIRCENFVPDLSEPVPNRVVESTSLCRATAREFYKELRFQIKHLTSDDPVDQANGLKVIGPGSTFVYPDGTFTMGTGLESLPPGEPCPPACPSETGLIANIDNLFGGTKKVLSIENAFFYKVLDPHTVAFVGAPLFTFKDVETGDVTTKQSIQTSIYRQVANQPDGSGDYTDCRSPANVDGDLCWTDMHEQWVYGQPLLLGP